MFPMTKLVLLAFLTCAGMRNGSLVHARSLSTVQMGSKAGYGTWYAGMGKPFGGCGVPPGKAFDDNGKPLPFVALNTNSEFKHGSNCGRWVKMVLGENCQGGGNDDWNICKGGTMRTDGDSGSVLYGYVLDHCPDENHWCQKDYYHLDISKPYLDSMGLTQGSRFNARMLHWDYINYVPDGYKMEELKFMWMEGSRWIGYNFWATVIIRNTPNGIGKVEQKLPNSMGGEWVNVNQLTDLGNNYELTRPCVPGSDVCENLGSIPIRVYGKSGELYGAWEIAFTCGSSHCSPSQDAPATRMA